MRSASRSQPQSWNRYCYTLNNPLQFTDPDGKTVASALGQITEYAVAIKFASEVTGGRVTPMEIARVLFQENRNDFNLINDNDKSAILGAGGPEIKNVLARLETALGSTKGSFGLVEMKVGTAARLLGRDPENLTADQRNRIQKMLSNSVDSWILAALYLDHLKQQRPNAPTEVILKRL